MIKTVRLLVYMLGYSVLLVSCAKNFDSAPHLESQPFKNTIVSSNTSPKSSLSTQTAQAQPIQPLVLSIHKALTGDIQPSLNSRDVPTIQGTFTGLLPCANCRGYQTTLTFSSNGHLTEHIIAIDSAFPLKTLSKGTWKQQGDMVTVHLPSEDLVKYFKVNSPTMITQRQDAFNDVSGPTAQYYALTKK